jgi:Delta7-sterol 5-desaturase
MSLFDIWFYCTHVAMHYPVFWHYIHSFHHQFMEPSAFGQDAVHPLEAVLQGPCGHFMITLIFPMHPVLHSLFGFLTGLYAIFAHDGRWDPADHNKHHYYTSCNYGLYGFMDYIFGTKYKKSLYPVEYVPTWVQHVDPKKYNG